MTPPQPHIAIIGAGPGGLILALLLHNHQIPFTVFERDASTISRWQGGTLDLHPESGQRALKAAGVWPQISQHLRREGEDFVCADKDGVRHINQQGEEHDRPELDRGDLRKVLLGALPSETIRWGAHVEHVKAGGIVVLVDGTEETFDLVVGADGAWSKVRPLLTDVVPHYSGISGIDVCFSAVDTRHPEIANLVGQGTYVALGDSKSLIAQRNGDGSIRVYVWAQRPESWLQGCRINFSDGPAAKAALAKDYSDWAPELRELITLADDEVTPRSLYMLPPTHRWESKPGFTLLGDAAHLMTPFAGEGVNLALLDALELSQAIVSATTSEGNDASAQDDDKPSTSTPESKLAAAVRNFEETMTARAQQKAEETWQNRGTMICADAPGPFVKRMEELMAGGGPPPE